jgi:hypothetical protein
MVTPSSLVAGEPAIAFTILTTLVVIVAAIHLGY